MINDLIHKSRVPVPIDAQYLRDFETEVADLFNAGKIRAPVHLYDGNEQQMIDIFKPIRPQDWVCCSWRSHYQQLLKGVPRDRLLAAIVAGHSIALCFPEFRTISSAIVGGILPIALGIAWEIKRSGEDARVYCFLGDMTAETGIFHECEKYSAWFDLPINWVIEDNGKSVCTDTAKAWGFGNEGRTPWTIYDYESKYPHAGAGKRVQF